MPRPFAEYYDLIYADKNYDKDIADFAAIVAHPRLKDLRILEIGAGTGNQTVRLAGLVKELTSVEIDPDFADVIERKLAISPPPNVAFWRQPLAVVDCFHNDAAVAFFHVLNYVGPDEIFELLRAIADRLRPGAPLIADVWGYGAMVDPPRPETRIKRAGTALVTQKITPTLNDSDRRLFLDYEIEISGLTEPVRFGERLNIFLWHPEELSRQLVRAGFHAPSYWDYRQFPASAETRSYRVWLRSIRR